ncbi:hypothetical protein EVAR_55155_1 [Eumeta japonica]|uniref:Uncharacterized protein n=1 Tax=Eumeta variegata TaxID=151549 RepID=A0A4C1YB39_EUMVA|nr:hypothetical protein EVAR_55155_1 [Eumeta japonica]
MHFTVLNCVEIATISNQFLRGIRAIKYNEIFYFVSSVLNSQERMLALWSYSRAGELSNVRWSLAPLDTRNLREVTSTLSISREGIGYLMERGRVYKREVGHRYFRALDETQQRKLLLYTKSPCLGSDDTHDPPPLDPSMSLASLTCSNCSCNLDFVMYYYQIEGIRTLSEVDIKVFIEVALADLRSVLKNVNKTAQQRLPYSKLAPASTSALTEIGFLQSNRTKPLYIYFEAYESMLINLRLRNGTGSVKATLQSASGDSSRVMESLQSRL